MATLPVATDYNPYEAKNINYPTETYRINRSTKRIDKMTDGIEAMRQAIEIILNTERYRYQIYTTNFGHELHQLIGKPPEYVMSMVTRRIEEAFSVDARIIRAENFKFEEGAVSTDIHCTFDVKTVFGTVSTEVDM